ncbi:MAG: hypothetical protein ACE5PV_08310 [Candidatus Poribacteria bacterium]
MEEDINFGELLRELQPDFLNELNENINEFRKFFDRLAEEQDNSLAIEKIYRILAGCINDLEKSVQEYREQQT